MPNWCNQHLTVQGDKEALRRFVADAAQEDIEGNKSIGLNHFVPCPQALVDTMEGSYGDQDKQNELIEKQNENKINYGFATWYDWANVVWGTKWGACDVQVNSRIKSVSYGDQKQGEIEISFQSAWSPASGLIAGISMLYPTLIFAMWFDEESNAFAGWQIFKNGVIVAEHDYKVKPPTDEEYPDEDDWRDAYEVWQDEFTGQLAITLKQAIRSVHML